MPVTSAEAVASTVGDAPTAAALDVTEPLVSTDPSEGYEKPALEDDESFGADT
jgi:hypothetical protein